MNNQGWISFDQWINATFFKGWADETISARAYRNASKGKVKWQRAMRFIDALFFWEPEHCKQSYLMECDRLQMPPAYRTLYNESV